MEGWRQVKLGEVVDLKQGFAVNKKSNHYISNDGIPLLKISDLIKNTETLFVRKNIPKQFLVYEDEIIYSRTGQVGLAFMGRKGVVYNNCFKVIPKEDVYSKFLYCLLNMPHYRSIARSLATGAAQPDLNHDAFKSIKIQLPHLPIQKKIAKILSAYDDLIENNLKRIKLLEELAQITYEEWFLYRRINGEIIGDDKICPTPIENMISGYRNGGWGKEEPEGNYTAEAFVIRGTDIPDIRNGKFTRVPYRYHTLSNFQSRQLKIGDIVMEMSNGNIKNVGRSLYFDEGIKEYLGDVAMCASFCKMMRPKKQEHSYLIDQHIKYIHRNNQMLVYKSQAANGINNFRFEDMIKDESINIPEGKILDLITNRLGNYYKAISTFRKQIHFLSEARDILLPRLMTGMIDVEEYNPADLLKEVA